jgi:hypothetical protein
MMPPLSVWALRASLVWFAAGISIGALLLIDKGSGAVGLSVGWLHTHLHLLLFGWLVQTVFAVAYWMLPRFGRKRPRAVLAVVATVLLNATALIAFGFVWTPLHRVVASLELAAVVLFAVHAWPRIKSFGAK